MEETETKTKLVVGFMYYRATESVVLIRKNRPDWMNGCLNGVGGHVEVGESFAGAVVREFLEETGAVTTVDQWSRFCRLDSNHGTDVTFFAAIVDEERECPVSTCTDEIVRVTLMRDLDAPWNHAVPNMAYLVPMGWYHVTHGAIDVSVVEREMR